VVKRVASLKDLREIWTDSSKRRKFIEALREQSIYPELLSSLLKRPDADAFDIIAHIAFGVPIFSRDERANAFKNRNIEFLSAFGPQAQEVLLALLDKYRIGGIEEISRPEVFRLPPFDKMKYITGIAKLFGGFDNLRKVIDEVQKRLYPEFGFGEVKL
jgi:type I restriction enzyme R subunit